MGVVPPGYPGVLIGVLRSIGTDFTEFTSSSIHKARKITKPHIVISEVIRGILNIFEINEI